MREDAELLRCFVEQKSQEDFAELVRRHGGLVYHAALRRVQGRADIAKDITQDVFANLARQAGSLLTHPVLSGWLYTTTRFVANRHLRDEHRRCEREREAQMRNELNDEKPPGDWEEIHRELDGAMDRLEVRDREAILLRFFHGQAFAEIGARTGLSEDAARKRVDRALDRLKSGLVKKGVVSAAVMLGSVLSAQAAQAVPSAIGPSLASAALAQAATAKLPVAAVVHFMSAKIGIQLTAAAIVAGLLFVAGSGVIVHEVRAVQQSSERLQAERKTSRAEAVRLDDLKKNVMEADARLTRLQSEVDQEQRKLSGQSGDNSETGDRAAASVGSPGKPAEEKNRFLTEFPEARPLLLEVSRAQFRAQLSGFYEMAQLTPAQIERFELRTAEYLFEHIATTKKSIRPTVSELPEAETRALLGEDAYVKYQEFKRLKPAYSAASSVALAIAYMAPPLSPKQSLQVAQVISSNANSGGGRLDINQVDWGAAIKGLETVMTPDQLRAAQPVLLDLQFKQAVNRADEKAQGGSKTNLL